MYRRLESTFCWKITGELRLFRYHTLQMEKEEIFREAYRIDCMLRLYDIFIELSGRMSPGELEACIRTAGLLEYLYGRWLKTADTQNEEMEHSLWSEIRSLCTGAA